MKKSIILIASILFLATGCNSSNQKQSGPQPLNIDYLLNVTIPNFADNTSQMINLQNGTVSGVNTFTNSTWDMKLDKDQSSYVIADFNHDGLPDIAAIIWANSGGTGEFAYLAIFTNSGSQPTYFLSKEIGDRVTINKVYTQNNILSVDLITQGPNDPMCCGTLHEVLNYGIENDSLVLIPQNAQ
jgi:hypothetical protein